MTIHTQLGVCVNVGRIVVVLSVWHFQTVIDVIIVTLQPRGTDCI